MANRTYAQISCSITRSKKIKAQSDHAGRYAYLCTHFSQFGNYSGLFHYPQNIWANDALLTVEDLGPKIEEMQTIGLVEYDFEEELVRIVGWYHKKNAPENLSRIKSLARDYLSRDWDNCGMFHRSIAEFVVGSIRRMQSCKEPSKEWPEFRGYLKPYLQQIHKQEGDDFLKALYSEMVDAGGSVTGELTGIYPAIETQMLMIDSTPSGQGGDRVPPHGHDMRRHGNEHDYENDYENVPTDFPKNGYQPETEHQGAVIEEFRTKGTNPKRPPVLASEAAKKSALVTGSR